MKDLDANVGNKKRRNQKRLKFCTPPWAQNLLLVVLGTSCCCVPHILCLRMASDGIAGFCVTCLPALLAPVWRHCLLTPVIAIVLFISKHMYAVSLSAKPVSGVHSAGF